MKTQYSTIKKEYTQLKERVDFGEATAIATSMSILSSSTRLDDIYLCLYRLYDDKFKLNYKELAELNLELFSDHDVEVIFSNYKPLLDRLNEVGLTTKRDQVNYLIIFAKGLVENEQKAREATPSPDNE
jgi:hypothetical protein